MQFIKNGLMNRFIMNVQIVNLAHGGKGQRVFKFFNTIKK